MPVPQPTSTTVSPGVSRAAAMRSARSWIWLGLVARSSRTSAHCCAVESSQPSTARKGSAAPGFTRPSLAAAPPAAATVRRCGGGGRDRAGLGPSLGGVAPPKGAVGEQRGASQSDDADDSVGVHRVLPPFLLPGALRGASVLFPSIGSRGPETYPSEVRRHRERRGLGKDGYRLLLAGRVPAALCGVPGRRWVPGWRVPGRRVPSRRTALARRRPEGLGVGQ